jgi:hypothetical protein
MLKRIDVKKRIDLKRIDAKKRRKWERTGGRRIGRGCSIKGWENKREKRRKKNRRNTINNSSFIHWQNRHGNQAKTYEYTSIKKEGGKKGMKQGRERERIMG